MNTNIYTEVIELEHQQGLLRPVNQLGIDFVSNLKHREIVYVKDAGQRDIKFHRAYFALLNYIYSWMPGNFKSRIPHALFHTFIKEITGQYVIKFTFKDGKEIKEYTSISFGKMTQKKFEEYIKNQLPLIYDNLIHAVFTDDKADMVIENIEYEFEKFMSKL